MSDVRKRQQPRMTVSFSSVVEMYLFKACVYYNAVRKSKALSQTLVDVVLHGGDIVVPDDVSAFLGDISEGVVKTAPDAQEKVVQAQALLDKYKTLYTTYVGA